jgi:hypothetical protein
MFFFVSAEGFVCSLNVLFGALGIGKLPTDMVSKKGFYVALVQEKLFFCYEKSCLLGGGEASNQCFGSG